MRKFFIISIVLLGILILFAFSSEAHAQELVLDPGFENGTDWIWSDYGSGQSSTYAHSGTYSGSVWGFKAALGIPNTPGYVYQDIVVEPGTYTLSQWIKYQTYLSRSTNFEILACVYKYVPAKGKTISPCTSWTTIKKWSNQTTSFDWTYQEDEIEIVGDYDRLTLWYQYSASAYWGANIPKWYIDDVSLTKNQSAWSWLIPVALANNTTTCNLTATTAACISDTEMEDINYPIFNIALGIFLFLISMFLVLEFLERKGVTT